MVYPASSSSTFSPPFTPDTLGPFHRDDVTCPRGTDQFRKDDVVSLPLQYASNQHLSPSLPFPLRLMIVQIILSSRAQGIETCRDGSIAGED